MADSPAPRPTAAAGLSFAFRTDFQAIKNIATPTKIIAGATAFGAPLKDKLISLLRNLGLPVEDLGAGDSIAADVGLRVSSSRGSARGLVVCGDGVSGAVLAGKFLGASATACFSVDDAVNVRSICNSNILAISALSTPLDPAVQILLAWLETPFKSPCPASNGQPWSDDVQESLDRAQIELARIGVRTLEPDGCVSWAMCPLANPQVPNPFEMIPRGSVEIIGQNPEMAIVRFEAGSVERAHHHTFGHTQVVLKGKMSVWNLSTNEVSELRTGDDLFTGGGDVHMVEYLEDTELVIKYDGHWDMFFDLEPAEMAIGE